MKHTLDTHIDRLRQHYGSYSETARRLGVDPRSFRRNRSGVMHSQLRNLIITSSRLLALRSLLRELIRSGEVSPAALRKAGKTIRALRSQ